jgi:type VI secretion system protein ImpH
MAAEDRTSAQHLTFLQAARATARRWGLFPLVRGAEARAPHLPPVGRSRLPSQNIVDLGQNPSMGFADSTIEEIELKHGRPRILGLWLGLTGPMGPLPTHLTEFAVYEKRYASARPFGRFLDMLSGRMLQFFYRAWADSQPAVTADRPQDDNFARYLAVLTGAAEGADANSAFPPAARLHYAALFASQRSARGLEDALSHLLCHPVQVQEFQPRWHDIEPGDRTRLGQAFCRLDGEIVAGSRVRASNDAFRVVISCETQRLYESLLPSGSRFPMLAEALNAFAPSHLEWDVLLEIDEGLTPQARLDGRTRLGWTGWLAPAGRAGTIRRDTIITKQRRPQAA